MRFWNYFVLFLVTGLVLTPLTSAAVINPNTNRGIDLCWIPGVGWILNSCDKAGGGSQGPMGPAGEGNTTNFYNGTYNQSLIFSNVTNLWNLTVENNLTVYSDYVTFINITQSEMNQTPNMTAGPPGADGSNGINGLDNMTANMTAGPQGIQGVNGTEGLQGIQGDKGDKGDKGDQGLQGVNGTPGEQGIQGEQGNPGLDNMTANMTAGPQGIQGIQGIQGVNGTPGEQGIQGEQGLQGETGEIGAANMTMNQTINMTGNMTMNQTMLDESVYPFLNGSRILTGIWNFGGYNISNVGNPIVSTDAATWGWVVSQISSALMPYDTIANQSTVNASIQSLIISVNNTQVANVSANNASMKNYVDTVNATGITDHGQLTGLTDDDHTQYLPVSLSRAVSGSDLARDVTNSNLKIYGGTSAVGAGAYIALFGKTSPSTAGYIRFYANNAAGDDDLLVMYIRGGTDTPYLHMNSRQIKYLLDPTAAQDAATMHYVEYPTVTAAAQANALCYNTTTKRVTYNSGVTTCLASTEKSKTDITYISGDTTSRLMQLKSIYYKSNIDGQQHYGLLAEDVIKIFPELAARDENGELTGVRYEEFTGVLLKGYQEQQVKLDAICSNNPKLCEVKT